MDKYRKIAFEIMLSSFECLKEQIESKRGLSQEYIHSKRQLSHALNYLESLDRKSCNEYVESLDE